MGKLAFSKIQAALPKGGHILAIDFETANSSRDSICAIGVALIEDQDNLTSASLLCRPPELDFDYYNIASHCISENDVRHEPKFNVIWREQFSSIVEGATLVAHNASFDISVLRKSLDRYKIPYPDVPYVCTYKIAKEVWPHWEKYSLDAICNKLNISLNHHDAESDASACATVLLHACAEVGASNITELLERIKISLGKLYDGGYAPCSGPRRSSRAQIALDARTIESGKSCFNEEHTFFQQHFAFSGSFISMNKRDAMQKIVDAGGIPQNGVNKKTNYLVLGEKEYTNFIKGGGTG